MEIKPTAILKRRLASGLRGLVVPILLLLAACSDPAEQEAGYLEKGQELYEQGDDVKAKLEFSNALQVNPKSIPALYHLGLIAERQGEFQQAFKLFRTVADEQPEHAEAQVKLGQFYLAAGEREKAREQAKLAAELDPSATNLLILQGTLALRGQDPQAALDRAEEALAQDPDHVNAGALRARALADLGQRQAALEQLDRTIAAHPDEPFLRLLTVPLLLAEDRFEDVVSVFRNLQGLDPENYSHYRSLARLHLLRGDRDAAEQVVRDAVAAGAGGNDAKFQLLDLVAERRGPAAAIAELKEMVATEPDNHELRLRLAEYHVRTGNPDAARSALEEVMERDAAGPSGINARVGLARLAYRDGDAARGDALIEEVLAAEPANASALLMRARRLLAAERYDDATIDLRTVLRDAPDATEALRLLARAQLASEQPEVALDTLNRLVTAEPDDTAAKALLARVLAGQGDHDRALELVGEVLGRDPASMSALEMKAALLIAKKDWDAAKAAVEEIRAVPGSELHADRLASVLALAQGRYDEAISALERVRAADPTDEQALLTIARAYLANDDRAGAIDYVQTVIAASPDDALAHNLLGELQAGAGETAAADAALASFREAIRLRPEWATPYGNVAQQQVRAGELDAAVDILRQGIGELPDSVGLHSRLGVVQLLQEDYSGAMETFERVLELDPDNRPAANNLAALIANFRHEDPDAVAAALELAAPFADSDNPYFLDTLGWLQYRAEQLPEARANLERAVKRLPEHPELNYHLGMILYRLGEHEAARAALAKAVDGEATYPGVEEARATLAALREAEESRTN